MAHHSFRNHRKLRRLRDLLGVSKAEAYGTMSLLWDEAYETEAVGPDGLLVGWTADDIAASVDWTGDAGKLVDAMVKAELLECHGDLYAIHDYERWAPEYVKKRWSRLGLKNSKTDISTSKTPVCPDNGGQRRTTAEIGRLPNPKQPKANQPISCDTAAPVAGETEHREPSKPRKQRPVWDMLKAELFNDVEDKLLAKSQRSLLGELERELKVCCGGDEAEAVRLYPEAKRRYQERHPKWERTPRAVVKYWHDLIGQPAAEQTLSMDRIAVQNRLDAELLASYPAEVVAEARQAAWSPTVDAAAAEVIRDWQKSGKAKKAHGVE